MAQVPPSAPPEPRVIMSPRALEGGAVMAAGVARGPAEPAETTSPIRWAGQLLFLAAVYFAAAKLGLQLAIVHASATAVWPPTGIALAGLLILGYRAWPAVVLGAFVANLTTHGTIPACLGIATGNTLEALAGAWFANRFAHGRAAFLTGMDAFRFMALAGVVSTTISATLGVLSVSLGGDTTLEHAGPIWLTWWLGDMGGAFVVAPFILLWSERGEAPAPPWSPGQWLEAAIVFAVLLGTGQVVFGWLAPVGPDPIVLKFLCMPILTWIAYRFDARAAATGVLLLATVAVTGTLRLALAGEAMALNESLQLIQVYLAVTAIATLVLAAAVDERARAERAMRRASEELREALSDLQAFSHAISHDLRSPVAAVGNYAQILEEDVHGRLDAESIRILQRIRASASAAGQLLEQLVKFVWAGLPNVTERMLDMTALAREACAEVVVGSEDGGAVQFEVQELPSVRGNPQMLGRVLHNLLSNAVKFTRGRETRRVVISGTVGEEENTYAVSDNGVGFDPALGDAVFQPFQRQAARNFAGTGLGLAIAAKIVRRHGGRVGAESDGSSGARFWFTLPNGGVR